MKGFFIAFMATMTALPNMPLGSQVPVQEKNVAEHFRKVEATEFKGWHAKQISNEWVKLVLCRS